MGTPSDLDSCRNILTGLCFYAQSSTVCFQQSEPFRVYYKALSQTHMTPAEPCVIWLTGMFLFTSPNSDSALLHAGLMAVLLIHHPGFCLGTVAFKLLDTHNFSLAVFFLNFLVMLGFGCCACGLSLAAVSRGCSLAAVHRLLVAVASLILEPGL